MVPATDISQRGSWRIQSEELSGLCSGSCLGTSFFTLQLGQQVLRPCLVFRLEPYLDEEELIRVGGRLRKAAVNLDARNPYLLPKDHVFTALLVCYLHKTWAGHMGREHMIASLHERYWIPEYGPWWI